VRWILVAVLTASLVPGGSVLALEKRSARMSDLASDWSAGVTCSIQYWNTCTGWVWIWSDWPPQALIGVAYEGCLGYLSTVNSSAVYVWTAAPSGYGFTGTIAVGYADANGCLANVHDSHPFLPHEGWNTYTWHPLWLNSPSNEDFIVRVALGPGEGNPIAFPTDHPAAGPTGPTSCGVCYPSDRPAHSFSWGTAGSPLCPGSPLSDDVCTAELLMSATVAGQISVEGTSWGSLKSLYR
jgi:hypothetical protein